MLTEVRGGCWVSCFITLYLIPLWQSLSLSLELGWCPSRPRAPPVSVLRRTRVTGLCACSRVRLLCGFWDLKLNLQACTANTLTHWAISPASSVLTMFLLSSAHNYTMVCLLHDHTSVCLVFTLVSGVCYTTVCLLCSFRAVCNPEATLQCTFPSTWEIYVQALRH